MFCYLEVLKAVVTEMILNSVQIGKIAFGIGSVNEFHCFFFLLQLDKQICADMLNLPLLCLEGVKRRPH